MMNPYYQLVVDIKDQLTVSQASWHDQPMVETQEIREAFAGRLSSALDAKQGIRRGRGRNVDLHAALRAFGVITTTQATHKWLRGDSMPEKDNMRQLAAWLGVSVQWLEYGEGEMIASSSPDSPSVEPAAVGGVSSSSLAAQQANMLAAIASTSSRDILARIAQAATDGILTEADIDLLGQIANRIAARATTRGEGPNQRISRKIRDAVKNPDRR